MINKFQVGDLITCKYQSEMYGIIMDIEEELTQNLEILFFYTIYWIMPVVRKSREFGSYIGKYE